ncbi:hypothetical protein Tco_0953134 [Tanacetum coccineum]|uniref:Uncharacterized protein n=1 Tax=Tanacetum coccineum TaxID=301880 RepID=A0ABQ5DZY9_9ASTR
MTTPIATSTTDSQMHNNIMAAGSRDRPPMLATGRYAQWRSRFLRYIDTRPNGDALRKCISQVNILNIGHNPPAVPATEDAPDILQNITQIDTVMNMTPDNKAHFQSEKEAIHLILTGIGDEIYSSLLHVRQLRDLGSHREVTTRWESLNSRWSRQTYFGVGQFILTMEKQLSLTTQDSTR